MSENRGNPYRKDNGRFGSSTNYDYIVYEPNKESDMQRSKEQAKRSAEAEKPLSSKPSVLSSTEFDKQAKGKQLIYRGVKDNKEANMTAEQIVEDMLSNSPIYGGYHAHGYGMYFSTSKSNATQKYTERDNVITAFLNSKSRIITDTALYEMYAKETKSKTPLPNKKVHEYAMSKGYNVVHIEGGPSGPLYSVARKGEKGLDYYVVLEKDVLTVRGK